MLSIVIPVYNEGKTVENILFQIQEVSIDKEIIIVDDGSTDGTRDILRRIEEAGGQYSPQDLDGSLNTSNIRIFLHDQNTGKGAALNTGFQEVEGDVVVIQDADLEYDPQDHVDMFKLIDEDVADVVYGSRFKSGKPHRVLYFWHFLGNLFLTHLSNMFTNINLTDMETCYKMFRSKYIDSIDLKENGFGIEPEITAKLCSIPDVRFYEIGISYHGRTYDEGKKITPLDGVRAIYCILKYNLFS